MTQVKNRMQAFAKEYNNMKCYRHDLGELIVKILQTNSPLVFKLRFLTIRVFERSKSLPFEENE
jgi:hypothetical protein